jgi:predicted ester cyclase
MTDTVGAPVPQQRGLDAVAAAEAYFAAWNAHDGAGVAARVSGSYVDPTLPGPISGADIAAMVDGLCAAFPDLEFVHESTHVDADTVVARWRMRGTNDGAALPGAPAPTNATIDFPGIDVITVAAGQVDTVVGYFDRQLFVEQLGLQMLPAPKDEWPVAFGLATRVDLGNITTPGALSMTWIEVEPEEAGELQARSAEIVTALASEPTFIAFQSASVGPRNLTLTAWTSPEAAEAALARNAPHAAAMGRFLQERFGTRGFTSIWQPYRLNSQFASCPACGAYVSITAGDSTAGCACGREVDTVPYL